MAPAKKDQITVKPWSTTKLSRKSITKPSMRTPQSKVPPATRTTRTSTRTAAEPAPSPQPEEIDDDTDQPPTLESLATVVAYLSANAAETQDAIENMQERLNQWGGTINTINDRIEALTQMLQAGPGIRVPELPNPPLRNSVNGNNPQTLVQEHLAWIDQAILLSTVSLKLEVKDLVRLLPVEDRPRGRSTALPNSLSLDPRTGK